MFGGGKPLQGGGGEGAFNYRGGGGWSHLQTGENDILKAKKHGVKKVGGGRREKRKLQTGQIRRKSAKKLPSDLYSFTAKDIREGNSELHSFSSEDKPELRQTFESKK